MSRNELCLLKTESLMDMDRQHLVDIKSISIDMTKSKEERIQKYMEDVKNPYFFRVGDTPVQICYQNGSISLQESITNYLSNI